MERWEQFQGVYVHTPFCLQKCLYCDFPSYAGFSEEIKQRYVEALCDEIKIRSSLKEIPVAAGATVYFGGGTPTVLSVRQIETIVMCLKECGWWKNPEEATIEANPGTVDGEKLRCLRRLGFDRVSLGVQSLQDNELRALGRIHTAEQAAGAVEEARKAGFQRISVDLMSGIPCQTVESFQDTLKGVLKMRVSHVSVYSLILEEGTPLERMVAKGEINLPDEADAFAMYDMTTGILEHAGMQRYEISNYAVQGQESLHNKVYWHYEPYAAFGAGACTFTGNQRNTGTAFVEPYIGGWTKAGCGFFHAGRAADYMEKGCPGPGNNNPLSGSMDSDELVTRESLDKKTQVTEALIMGLRLVEGVDLAVLRKRFSMDILEYYKKEVETLKSKKMLVCDGEHLFLTPYGMQFGNRAFAEFV